MHRLKTGALIRAAVRLGARCGAALDADEAPRARRVCRGGGARVPGRRRRARRRGLDASLGKTAGKDAASNKPTYVALLGLDEAQARTPAALRAEAHAAHRAVRGARRAGSSSWRTGSRCGSTDPMTANLLETIASPADLRGARRKADLRAARARAARVPAAIGRADRRPPVVEPRHGRARRSRCTTCSTRRATASSGTSATRPTRTRS